MARSSKQNRAALIAARRKKVEQYWNDRAQSRVRANDRDGDQMKAEQEKAYRTARDRVRQEIDQFYRDFGNAAGMSAEEARQKLSRGELHEFQAELSRKRAVIQEMMRKDPNNSALKKYDTEWERLSKVRELTRKEALEANISAEIAQLGGKQQRSFDAHVNQVIHTGLKMNADDLKKLGDVDVKLGVGSPEQVMRAARENWQHSDFSDRIWADKDKLIQEAREVIEEGFARNKGAMDMATDLMTRMNVSHSNALRLVRTEFNHLSNQAAMAEYKANGVKKYKFVAAIDNRTCSVCHDLNGKMFNVAEARVGVNFPPIHPNCRSVTVPVIDWGSDDQWDYSNIELDDDELAALGLDDDDVKALDAAVQKPAGNAPKPALTVQEANRAAADTQSVVRRAELAEKLENQTLALDADMRRELVQIDRVSDELKRLEDLNRRMEAQGAAMTETRAAIEAERLEQVSLDLRERELEAARLQASAAKLDPAVPKPDRDEIDAKAAKIADDKAKREARRSKDLPDADIIAQATPSPFPELVQTAEDAVAPRTAIGRLWARVKREVEGVKAYVNHLLRRFDLSSGIFGMSKPDELNIMDVDQEKERKNFVKAIASLKSSIENAKRGGKKPTAAQLRKLAFYEGILMDCQTLPSQELAVKAFDYKEKYLKLYGDEITVVFAPSKGELSTKGTGEFDPYVKEADIPGVGERGIVRLMYNARPHVAAHEITHAMHYRRCPYAYQNLREVLAEKFDVDVAHLGYEDRLAFDEIYRSELDKLLKVDPFVDDAASDWAKLRKEYVFEAEWTQESSLAFMQKFESVLLEEAFNGKTIYQLNGTEKMQFLAFQEIICSFAQNENFSAGHSFNEYGLFHHEAVSALAQLLDNGNEKIKKVLENRFCDFFGKFLAIFNKSLLSEVQNVNAVRC